VVVSLNFANLEKVSFVTNGIALADFSGVIDYPNWRRMTTVVDSLRQFKDESFENFHCSDDDIITR
jgi:hypothetical protein